MLSKSKKNFTGESNTNVNVFFYYVFKDTNIKKKKNMLI